MGELRGKSYRRGEPDVIVELFVKDVPIYRERVPPRCYYERELLGGAGLTVEGPLRVRVSYYADEPEPRVPVLRAPRRPVVADHAPAAPWSLPVSLLTRNATHLHGRAALVQKRYSLALAEALGERP